MRCPTVLSTPASQKGKPGFLMPFGLCVAWICAGSEQKAAARSPESQPVTTPPAVTGRATLALLPTVLPAEIFGTTVTIPGRTAMGLPGSGTSAGMGVPASDLAVGKRTRPGGRHRDGERRVCRVRDGDGRSAEAAAGVPSFRANGTEWNAAAPPETSSGVPVSSTSWLRHSSHMPCAKCG